jgi:hypothetical protein
MVCSHDRVRKIPVDAPGDAGGRRAYACFVLQRSNPPVDVLVHLEIHLVSVERDEHGLIDTPSLLPTGTRGNSVAMSSG